MRVRDACRVAIEDARIGILLRCVVHLWILLHDIHVLLQYFTVVSRASLGRSVKRWCHSHNFAPPPPTIESNQSSQYTHADDRGPRGCTLGSPRTY